MTGRLIANEKIAIVGGGPGGLTLARLLQIGGADVTVYERDLNKDARVQGATLDLHEDSGLEALRHAGLMDAFMANYRPGADLLRIVDNQANLLYDQHDEPGAETFMGKHHRPEIDRGPLRRILLESLRQETVVWNSYTTALERIGGGWELQFQNGTRATADIVVGADGANSKIRPLITSIKPFYAGVTAIEASVSDSAVTVPRVHALLKGGKVFAMGNEKTLIVSSKGDGSLAFYMGLKTGEFWFRDSGIDFKSNAQMLAWFKQEFSEWGPLWHELFEDAETSFIPRPQYCVPLDQTWDALPDMTMLGDAAHLMPPYAGEGVNMAMLDALRLSQCLLSDEFEDVHSAIGAYEMRMRERASQAAKESLENTELMHAKDAISNMMEMFGSHNP